MSKKKERRLIAGVLSMLAASVFYPAAAGAAESEAVQTAQAAEAVSQHYATEPITVEAKRPDWEETLSPGTVTVIRPEEFKGEQKTLADFLKMRPPAIRKRTRRLQIPWHSSLSIAGMLQISKDKGSRTSKSMP